MPHTFLDFYRALSLCCSSEHNLELFQPLLVANLYQSRQKVLVNLFCTLSIATTSFLCSDLYCTQYSKCALTKACTAATPRPSFYTQCSNQWRHACMPYVLLYLRLPPITTLSIMLLELHFDEQYVFCIIYAVVSYSLFHSLNNGYS